MQGGPSSISALTVTVTASSQQGQPLHLHDLDWQVNPVVRDGDRVSIESVECALVGTQVCLTNGGCFLNPPQGGAPEPKAPLNMQVNVSAHQLDDEEQQQSALAVSGPPGVADTAALESVAKTAVDAGHIHIAETLALFGEKFDVEQELKAMLGNADGRKGSVLGVAAQVKDIVGQAAEHLRGRLRSVRDVLGDGDKHTLVGEANSWFVELMRDRHDHSVVIIAKELNIYFVDLSGCDFVTGDLLQGLISTCTRVEDENNLLAIHIKDTPAVAANTNTTPQQTGMLVHLLAKLPETRTVPEVVEGLVKTSHLNLSKLGWEEGAFPISELTNLLLQPLSSAWKCLHSLDISDNRLGPEGGKAIAASVAENTTLTSVSRCLFFRFAVLTSPDLFFSSFSFCIGSSMHRTMAWALRVPNLLEACWSTTAR
jgi:hypothetical protein